jgi:hypothetical protein
MVEEALYILKRGAMRPPGWEGPIHRDDLLPAARLIYGPWCKFAVPWLAILIVSVALTIALVYMRRR